MQQARAIAKSLGIVHNLSYYSPETKAFADVGLPEFWRAYVAYRCAPLGQVGPAAATAVLYNFAPRMVAAALPSAWDTVTPAQAIALRDDCMDRAMRRALGDMIADPVVGQAAEVARRGIDGTDPAGRALFAAHMDLPWPDEPHQQLWHACTLWREHRGDSHNIALAAAEIDGVEAHVLLAGKGVGTADVIEKIRGWNADEWQSASDRLRSRDLIDSAGTLTDSGQAFRRSIEDHTDELCKEPRVRLGSADADRLIDLVTPIAAHMVETGAVAGRWPPKNPIGRSA